MKIVFRVMCVVVVCLCLLRNLFGVVEKNPDGFNTGFSIQEKFETFASAEVFDFDSELIHLQLMQYSFDNLVARMGTDYGSWYRVYYIHDGVYTPDSESGQNVWTYIRGTDLGIKYTITEEGIEKGEEAWYEIAGNFFVGIWDLFVSVGRFIGSSVISMIQAIAELARLVINIVFVS